MCTTDNENVGLSPMILLGGGIVVAKIDSNIAKLQLGLMIMTKVKKNSI